MSADCHDWAGYCLLCDSWQKYAVPVPAHLQRLEGAHMHLLWSVGLDCYLCRYPDFPVNGEI